MSSRADKKKKEGGGGGPLGGLLKLVLLSGVVAGGGQCVRGVVVMRRALPSLGALAAPGLADGSLTVGILPAACSVRHAQRGGPGEAFQAAEALPTMRACQCGVGPRRRARVARQAGGARGEFAACTAQGARSNAPCLRSPLRPGVCYARIIAPAIVHATIPCEKSTILQVMSCWAHGTTRNA